MKVKKMTIELGKIEALDRIVDIIKNSPLGDVYFMNKDLCKIISDAISKEEVHVLLETDIVLGFIWSNKEGTFGKYPYLHMLIIDQNYRNKGYGSSLIAYFENVLYKEYDQVYLMVGGFNIRAKNLYERLGYKEVGILPGFYSEDVNEFLLMKGKNNE